jgi:uncharacterized membrane protein HdeD (DUF308 family)
VTYRELNTRPLVKLVGWLLIVHGVFCLFGAFFPVHPVIFVFYWFFPGPFILQLVIVLAGGAAQVIFGVYLAFRRMRRVGWYWLVLIGAVVVLALLVYPILSHFPGF